MGGLASSVIDTDFKKYMALFGIMIDLVAVDLQRTFHDLDGNTEEFKVAVPKATSPNPNQTLAA
uniref:Uncharacterized protein n=1 Tax=Brassica campestris TaxID=3711 RepID=A0A3P6C365_BRACM|nr:unnamed protein product [Brassica rapa]